MEAARKARIEYGKASPEGERAMYGPDVWTGGVVAIDGGHRLNIAFRAVPRTYQAARLQGLKKGA
jgi:hypothetical protein